MECMYVDMIFSSYSARYVDIPSILILSVTLAFRKRANLWIFLYINRNMAMWLRIAKRLFPVWQTFQNVSLNLVLLLLGLFVFVYFSMGPILYIPDMRWCTRDAFLETVMYVIVSTHSGTIMHRYIYMFFVVHTIIFGLTRYGSFVCVLFKCEYSMELY